MRRESNKRLLVKVPDRQTDTNCTQAGSCIEESKSAGNTTRGEHELGGLKESSCPPHWQILSCDL